MNVYHLAHPEWQFALAVLAAGALLAVAFAHVAAQRRARRLLGERATARSGARASDAALLLALVAIGLALLGPRIGERVLRVPATGVDVVLLVDVSASMDAADNPPSRLQQARSSAAKILRRLDDGDRAALAAVAGRGVLLTPLTPDRSALVELLDGLDTQLIHPRASRIGAGVDAALGAFEAASDRPRIVVLLSDGEDSVAGSDLGAAGAARVGVRVIAVALGTDRGGLVPDGGAPLRDAVGRVVHSRRRVEPLARLAAATQGALFRADDWGHFDVDAAVAAVRRHAGSARGEIVERRVRAVRVLPFAATAFALLWLETASLRWLAGRARRRAVVVAFVTLFVLGAARPSLDSPESAVSLVEAQLRARPDDARLLVRLGLARLEAGRGEAAARAFFEATLLARDAGIASLAYYDLGVTALQRGDLAAARDAFFDALALRPDDARARYNLEWTLHALAERQTPPPRPPAPTETTPVAEAPSEPEPEAREPRRTRAAETRPADEAQRARWLARVRDDPARALRSIAGEGAKPGRRIGPAW